MSFPVMSPLSTKASRLKYLAELRNFLQTVSDPCKSVANKKRTFVNVAVLLTLRVLPPQYTISCLCRFSHAFSTLVTWVRLLFPLVVCQFWILCLDGQFQSNPYTD